MRGVVASLLCYVKSPRAVWVFPIACKRFSKYRVQGLLDASRIVLVFEESGRSWKVSETSYGGLMCHPLR